MDNLTVCAFLIAIVSLAWTTVQWRNIREAQENLERSREVEHEAVKRLFKDFVEPKKLLDLFRAKEDQYQRIINELRKENRELQCNINQMMRINNTYSDKQA